MTTGVGKTGYKMRIHDAELKSAIICPQVALVKGQGVSLGALSGQMSSPAQSHHKGYVRDESPVETSSVTGEKVVICQLYSPISPLEISGGDSWFPRPLSSTKHKTSSVAPFSSCLQSFPASGSFPMSQFFASGGQSIGASASASVFPMNIQG